ncbi:MAG: uroporphyrinogen-III synthase [Thermoplasmata archaeon]|jgi:uroporphyrinogen-III synthase|nr:uroporphyrinogen-III synthase [Thermoplasmata archaeon]
MTVLGFTRPASKLQDSILEAESLGFKVYAAPSLEVIHGDASEFARLKDSVYNGVPVIFGSTTAADHCSREYRDEFPVMISVCEVIAIGPGTAERLESLGVRVDLIPDDYSSFGLVDMIKERYHEGRIIVVRSDSGTDIISKGIVSMGLELVDIAAYKLVAAEVGEEMESLLEAIDRKELDWMAFTSPMSASTFFDRMEEKFGEQYSQMMKDHVKVAAIGRPTADMLASLGRNPDLIPDKTTFHDLLLAIRDAERGFV